MSDDRATTRTSTRRCSECDREFVPDHRVGNRQRTCGDSECQRLRLNRRKKERYHTDEEYRERSIAHVRNWYRRKHGTTEFRDRARESERRYRDRHRDDPKYRERRREADRKRRAKNPRAGKAEKGIVLDEREQSIFERLKEQARAGA